MKLIMLSFKVFLSDKEKFPRAENLPAVESVNGLPEKNVVARRIFKLQS